jgi:hypothetical protein
MYASCLIGRPAADFDEHTLGRRILPARRRRRVDEPADLGVSNRGAIRPLNVSDRWMSRWRRERLARV